MIGMCDRRVRGLVKDTGYPIDGHVLYFSQWQYDNHTSWHLDDWETADDQAVMETLYEVEKAWAMAAHDTLEAFAVAWQRGEYQMDGVFCLELWQVEVVEELTDIFRQRLPRAIAIDFDGCLCADAYPAIGAPHWHVIKRAQIEREAGAKLILWTCREGALLAEAVAACRSWGLEFDAVNENLPEWVARFGGDPRKIGASEYWDDRALRLGARVW